LFLDTHDYRYGVIVSGVAEGRKIRETGLGYCEVREVKGRLEEELREFLGDDALADSLHVPAWRGNIQVDRARAACRLIVEGDECACVKCYTGWLERVKGKSLRCAWTLFFSCRPRRDETGVLQSEFTSRVRLEHHGYQRPAFFPVRYCESGVMQIHYRFGH
jgi:hypothetical protein